MLFKNWQGVCPSTPTVSHAAQELAGRVSVIGNSIFEEGTKVEWFFDESRASVRQQWASDRKSARPQVRDQDFLAKNAAIGGVSVSQERQRLADFENELDQVFTQLPKYVLTALTAAGDMRVFDATPISRLFEDLKERAAEKWWSAVRMHGALLALRHPSRAMLVWSAPREATERSHFLSLWCSAD